MFPALRRGCAAFLLSCLVSVPAFAAPEIVVSPYLMPTTIARAGSAVTVITRDEIENSSAGSVAELLRSVPGLSVTESGGPGSTMAVRLRGAETQHTLVLIDGIRVGDPSAPRGDFDFSLLSPTDIERIEVLRGPQSALYGSDAMGGVINIITRKHTGPSFSATAQGGSYGTRAGSVSASQSAGPLTLSGGGSYFKSDGFSRVGDRHTGERDPTEKYAGTFRGTLDLGGDASLVVGVDGQHQFSLLDKNATTDASGYSMNRDLFSGFAKLAFPSADGKLKNTVTAFSEETVREFVEPTRVTNYRGGSTGVEYQGLYALPHGSLLFGTRFEQENAFQQQVGSAPSFDGTRQLYAGYVIYQLPVAGRWDLSFAGRYDGEIGGDGFTTGRVTAVYDWREIEARIRASAGTGAKRPTAYQLSWNPALLPETSFGADVGWDQTLFDGRANVSATAFYNRFHNLIDFSGSFSTGNYQNVQEAETAGLELSGTATLVSGVLSGSASYTYLYTHDLSMPAGVPLERRPTHSGKLTLTYTGIERLTASASATYVGDRFNDDSGLVPLPGYVRIDLDARYRLNDHTQLFGRVENLTNAVYQDVLGYNTPGLSAYVGLTWKN